MKQRMKYWKVIFQETKDRTGIVLGFLAELRTLKT